MSAAKKPVIASVSVGLGDSPDLPEQDLPRMRVVVVAEAGPHADHGVAEGAGGFVRVERDLDSAMAALGGRVVVEVALPLVDGARERIEIPIDSLKVFRPAGLAERVAPLAALVEARRALGAAPGSDEAKAARTRALTLAPNAMRAALSEVLEAPRASAPAQASSAPGGGKSAIDDLFDRVGVGAEEVAAAPSAISAIARSAGSGDVDPTLGGRTARIDAALTRGIATLLAHSELRRLERVWTSLKLLREHAGESVVVDLVAVSQDAAAEALAAIAEHAESSGEGVDLIVVDQCVGTAPVDAARLEAYALEAERMHAPLLASTVPEVLGFDELAQLARSQRRLGAPDDPRTAPIRAFMARDAARWVLLSLNGPLLRAPFQTNVAGVRFTEGGDGFVHALPAFAVAAVVSAAFSRDAWPAPHDGPRHGTLANLAVRQEGDSPAWSLEHPMAIDVQKAAARAGVALWGGPEGRDQATLAFAPMAFRGAAFATGGDPPAALTLSDQLLIARVVSVLKQLTAEIPAGTPAPIVKEVALLSLASSFPEGDRPEVATDSDGRSLVVRVDAKGWRGVTIGTLEMSAALAG